MGGGAYHKDSKYLCSSFAVKAGGGLTFEGGVFSGEYGIKLVTRFLTVIPILIGLSIDYLCSHP